MQTELTRMINNVSDEKEKAVRPSRQMGAEAPADS